MHGRNQKKLWTGRFGGGGCNGQGQADTALEAFSFGPFRIFPYARLLECNGSPTPIGSRAFDLLCLLAGRPGEVVSKGELMARVWPDVMVEEGSLRFHVTMLRRILGDGQKGERYVVNVHGRGYCFVARVGRAGSPPKEGHQHDTPVPTFSIPADRQLASI